MLWYNYVFSHYPNIPQIGNDIANITIYSAFSVCLFAYGSKQENRYFKWFVFYALGEFWAFLVLNMVYNTFIYDKVVYHKTVFALGAVLGLNLIVSIIFFVKWLLRKLF